MRERIVIEGYTNITSDLPMLGFTGALGSGCSYFAKGLADFHRYVHCHLSSPIHAEAARRGLEHTAGVLLDIGNEMRRQYGPNHLARLALDWADKQVPPPDSKERPAGVILDGIRNTGELEALRQGPNFYLFSVQADMDKRQERLVGTERCPDEKSFEVADKRDQEEKPLFGQQVRKCNDLADVIVINDKSISKEAEGKRREYIEDKLYKPFVSLIERVAAGEAVYDVRPSDREALMTAAYCESRRSSCLKRKVGAIIARTNGEIISAAHNDVPEGTAPCLDDDRYLWCARDVIQEHAAQQIKHCPNCGNAIKLAVTCPMCSTEITSYTKRCPNCKYDPEIRYACEKCGIDVFAQFLPGHTPGAGKLLDMCMSLHAEENAILNLVKQGLRTPPDAVIYTTTFPCNLCAKKIVAAGIKKVVYAEPYPMEESRTLFIKEHVAVERFEGVKNTAYFRLYS